jgi:hypothetical protein
MKLHELGAQRPTEQVAQTLAQRLGEHIDFDRLNESQARKMLGKVQGLLREHRSSVSRHFSERNPDYIKLVMLEQALTSRVQEQTTTMPGGTTPTQNPAAAMVKNDPKARAVTDKVMRGQKLSPEEQETVNRLALAKENKKARRMVRESEIQTAQVVLAAQDMVDRVQGMLEDISEMQFKDLPALTDSIKNDMGVEQATQFQQQAAGALTQLLAAVQAGKTSLEGAQGILTGQAPQVPGTDMMPAAQPDVDADSETDIDADLSLDANLPDEEEDLPAAGLGRERR